MPPVLQLPPTHPPTRSKSSPQISDILQVLALPVEGAKLVTATQTGSRSRRRLPKVDPVSCPLRAQGRTHLRQSCDRDNLSRSKGTQSCDTCGHLQGEEDELADSSGTQTPPPPLCCFLLSATQMNRCGAEEPEVAPEAPPSGFRTPIWRVAAFSKKCQSRSIFKEISKKRLSEAFGTLVDFDTRESSPNCRKCRAFPRSLFELTPWLLPTWTQIASEGLCSLARQASLSDNDDDGEYGGICMARAS